jgi:hypothetical protein
MIVIDIGLFGNVIACDGNLNIVNCQFENLDFPGQSDVYTHGNIDIKNSYIDGDVKASGTVTVGSSTTITGDIVNGAPVLQFPAVDAQIHKDKALAGGTYNGNLNVSSSRNLGPLYINGNLTIGSGATVTLTGTVYVTGAVSMSNADIGGFGDLVTEGNITFTNYTWSVVNPVTLPLIMSVGVGKTLNLNNDKTLGTMAILYIPNGSIVLGNVDIYGSVAAPLITLNNATVKYPAELRGRADLPGAGLDTVTYTFK